MKKPNSYGSIVKLSGKRRQPYAVRTSSIVEYISVSCEKNPPQDALAILRKYGFRYNARRCVWCAPSDSDTDEAARKIATLHGYATAPFAKQDFKYLAYFEKQNDAVKYLAEYNSGDVIEEQRRFTDSPTFAEMYEKWVEYRQSLKKKVSDSAWKNYALAYRHMKPLHNLKISSIRASEIQDAVNLYNDKAEATVGSIRAILRGVFRYAKMNRYIKENPVDYVVFEFTKPDKSIHRDYSEDEINLLWDNVGKVKNVDIILIFIYTGMRPSELLSVKTADIHLEEQYLVGGSKTEAGRNRIVPLCDKIMPLVRARYNKDNEYFILNTHKNPYSYRPYWDHCHNPLMEKLGLDHKPHDTRHTFITLMDRAGANETILKIIVGHSLKADVTKAVYTHKSVEEMLKEVNKI